MMAHLVLVQQKIDLRERHRAVDATACRKVGWRERGEARAELAQAGILLLQRRGRVIAQTAIDARQTRIKGGTAQVGGHDRELSEHVSDVLMLNGGKFR